MHQVMDSIRIILEEAGSSLANVVKVNAYLARVEDGQEMFAIYRSYFDEPYPALTTVGAGFVREQILLEIDCIAELQVRRAPGMVPWSAPGTNPGAQRSVRPPST